MFNITIWNQIFKSIYIFVLIQMCCIKRNDMNNLSLIVICLPDTWGMCHGLCINEVENPREGYLSPLAA